MRITLTGATGFLGSHLTRLLRGAGHELRVLSRNPSGRPGFYSWDPSAGAPPLGALEGSQAVIHLAGEPLAQRWTPEAKMRIRRSRIEGTRNLVDALAALPQRPEVLVCASAIGYYGSRGDESLPETAPPGEGFVPEVCVEWERAADLALPLGIRVVQVRTGLALGKEGGALRKMLPPFQAGVAGPLAGGQQWMSWIHVTDLVRMIAWMAETPQMSGPVNGVSPNPLRNKDFTRLLARQLKRPAVMPVPSFALHAIYGEMAGLLIESQKVVPAVAMRADFRFQFPALADALRDLL